MTTDHANFSRRNHRSHKGVPIKLAIVIFIFLVQAVMAAETAYNPVFITDAGILNTLEKFVRPSLKPLSGKDVEIGKSLGDGQSMVILVNGTEAGRLTAVQTREVLDKYPGIFTATSTKANVGRRIGLIEKHFSHIETIKALGRWDTGIRITPSFTNEFTGAALQSASLDMDYLGQFGFVYAGAGASYLQYVRGSLSDVVSELNPGWAEDSKNFVARIHIGLPWMMYELNYSGNNLPEYYWLQENLDKKYFNADDSRLIRSYVAGTSGRSSVAALDQELQYKLTDGNNRLGAALAINADTNTALSAIAAERERAAEGSMVNLFSPSATMDPLSHKLKLKMGMLYYELIYSGSYSTPIHRVYIDGVELFIGKWGMGVTSTKTDDNKTSFFPGVWLSAYEIAFPIKGRGTVMWSPIKIHYIQMRRSFVTGAQTVIHFKPSI